MDRSASASLLAPPSGPLAVQKLTGAPTGVRLSLIIPTYNESKSIGPLLARLTELLTPVLCEAYELIVVDDDSPDRTWELALGLAAQNPRVRVLRRVGERGLSSAVIRGWQAARGEVLGVMDADLQHPPEVNLKLWAEMERGADLATGSRHIVGGGVSNWSLLRRMLSRGAQFLGLLILPGVLSRVSDPMSGYFMVQRSAIAGVELKPLGYKILIEVLGRGNIRWVGEVGYVFRERVEGESKVSSRLYLEYLRHLLLLRRDTLLSSRLFRFCIVGATGALVDMGLLYVLSDPRSLGFGLTRSKLAAAEVALLSNFLLNDAWTFGDRSEHAPGVAAKLRRLLGFQAICTAGIVLNLGILNLLFNQAGMNRYLANAIAILAVTAWNYGLNKQLNWTPVPMGGSR